MSKKYKLHSLCKEPNNDSIDRIQRYLDKGIGINLLGKNGETPLGFAVRGKSLAIVRYLVEKGANPNLSAQDAFPPLVLAAAMGLKDIVSFLLSQPNIDVNVHQLNQATPLYLAAQEGHLEVLILLLRAGAKPLNAIVENEHVVNPLFISILNKHNKVAELLLQHFPELVNHSCGKDNLKPLHQAAKDGNVELVELLLTFKPDVNALCHKNETALFVAAINGYENIVRILLKAGAKPIKAHEDKFYFTPLYAAVQNKHFNVAELLLQYFPELANVARGEDGFTPLHRAAFDGAIQLVELLIAYNADVNALFLGGTTALSLAAYNGHVSVAELLLQRSAELINQPYGEKKYTPLHFAAIDGNIKLVELLIKFKADVNALGRFNVTPLHLAAVQGYLDILNALLKSGAKLIMIQNCSFTPLYDAVISKYYDVAKSLLQYFPENVNQPCEENGYTPLHVAAMNGSVDLVDLLIGFKADVNAFCHGKITPLYFAAANGRYEIVQRLLQLGVDYQGIGKKIGDDLLLPIGAAGREGHYEIVKVLLSYTYTSDDLKKALHYVAVRMLSCRNAEQRNNIFKCSELLKDTLSKQTKKDSLTLDNSLSFSLSESYNQLFSFDAFLQDSNPKNKESAIRRAIASIYQLLNDPKSCIPYLQFLSRELECQWKKEHQGALFPKFDRNKIVLWAREGFLWPISIEGFEGPKKAALLERILLDKFKQYGMGEECGKWTGFIPKKKSKALLLNNSFFTENRRTPSGLFHGNVHNIQRVLILYAIEAGKIPLTYINENDQITSLQPKEVFSALMRNDVFHDMKMQPLWIRVLDGYYQSPVSFTYPHCLHSMLLINQAFAGVLQDYLLFSFCSHYIKMRELYNHVYGTTYTNTTIFDELSKLMQNIVYGLAEFAIQWDEKRTLSAVSRIDELADEGRQWFIKEKHYESAAQPAARYSC